jgi:hypothetical protein
MKNQQVVVAKRVKNQSNEENAHLLLLATGLH